MFEPACIINKLYDNYSTLMVRGSVLAEGFSVVINHSALYWDKLTSLIIWRVPHLPSVSTDRRQMAPFTTRPMSYKSLGATTYSYIKLLSSYHSYLSISLSHCNTVQSHIISFIRFVFIENKKKKNRSFLISRHFIIFPQIKMLAKNKIWSFKYILNILHLLFNISLNNT